MGKANFDFSSNFKKRLYTLSLNIIDFLDQLLSDNVSHRLGDQLLRSGTSILANYIEAQSASSKKEFTKYLNISLRSANESKMWLALLRDSRRAKVQKANILLEELREVSNILASCILKAKGKK
jgi:four helix bundle protein